MQSEFDHSKSAVVSRTHKLALVVRTDLGMSVGKISSQCVHAAVAASRIAVPENRKGWFDSCEVTVVLAADSEATMYETYQKATRSGVPAYAWVDVGRTEVMPNTVTVLAIGPAPWVLVDGVCEGLFLLK
jgi:PTH2 family peptidyl-tRNA hydrolase